MESFGNSEVFLCASRLLFDRRFGVGLPHATIANLKENHFGSSFSGEIAWVCVRGSDSAPTIAKAIK
jgi:hypothetical protein